MSSDPKLLWLWRRPVATALIGPLAREPPYAAGSALKRKKKEKDRKERKKRKEMGTQQCLAPLPFLLEESLPHPALFPNP